jgi:hypothetical protein
MQPLTHALPGAIAELLRDVPVSSGKVDFAWRVAVGTSLERVTSVQLEGGILRIFAEDKHWAREITRSSAVILARLRTLLGQDAVNRMEVRER